MKAPNEMKTQMSNTHLTPEEVKNAFIDNSIFDDLWSNSSDAWPGEEQSYFEHTFIVSSTMGYLEDDIAVDIMVYTDRLEGKTIIELYIPPDDIKKLISPLYHADINKILNERIECLVDTNKNALFDKLRGDYQHPVVTQTLEITDLLKHLLKMGMHNNG